MSLFFFHFFFTLKFIVINYLFLKGSKIKSKACREEQLTIPLKEEYWSYLKGISKSLAKGILFLTY